MRKIKIEVNTGNDYRDNLIYHAFMNVVKNRSVLDGWIKINDMEIDIDKNKSKIIIQKRRCENE